MVQRAQTPKQQTATRIMRYRTKRATKQRAVEPTLSIVIPVHERVTQLPATIAALYQWPDVREVIVVANGVPRQTLAQLNRTSAHVFYYAKPLGHDVGRAIGAMHAKGQFILFLDADIPFRVAELRPFLQALQTGADVVLNRYPLTNTTRYDHPTAVVKRALNLALERPDLQASSMTTVPHGIRRSALDHVSARYLAVPPVFQTRAVLAGLKVEAAAYVPVGRRNRFRPVGAYPYRVLDLILGDHIEAIHHLLQTRGPRATFPDATRRRDLIDHPDHVVTKERIHLHALTAVVPASNEAATIQSTLHALREADVLRVLVVDNGSTDDTAALAKHHGATIETYAEQLGHDVGRTLGAIRAADGARCVLFVDADFSIPPQGLRPFISAVGSGDIDMALNDLSYGLTLQRQRDPVSTMKRFLNLALQRPDLGVCSPTAVPHALSQRALYTLDRLSLCVPPMSLVRAVLGGLVVQPVTYVDVIRPNRYRRPVHSQVQSASDSKPVISAPITRLIIGDHLEALFTLVETKGVRAGYPQPRRLEVL